MASNYLSTAQKYSRLLIAGKITINEYAENLLNSCVGESEMDDTIARAIAVAVPDVARERLDQEIAKILDASYRYPKLHFGGPGPSEEVREEKRRLYETRIRAFAAALAKALGSR